MVGLQIAPLISSNFLSFFPDKLKNTLNYRSKKSRNLRKMNFWAFFTSNCSDNGFEEKLTFWALKMQKQTTLSGKKVKTVLNSIDVF